MTRDAVIRSVRTFVQAFVGALLATGVFQAISVRGAPDWEGLQTAIWVALAAGVIAFLSWAQNALEDGHKIPTVLK